MSFLGNYFNEMSAEGVVHAFKLKDKVFSGRSDFQEVEIVDTVPYGRLLLLDNQVQSAALDEFAYHETLVQPAMLMHPKPERVFIGGGGEGATAREILRHSSVSEVVMADIDPTVCRVCKDEMQPWHQGAFDDPRFKLVSDDAKLVLESYPDSYFDVIVLDLCDPLDYGPCYTLYAQEFYDMCFRKLTPAGVFVTQAGPASQHAMTDVFTPVFNTLKHSQFPHVYAYAVHLPSFAHMWGYCLAAKETSEPSSGEHMLPRGNLKSIDTAVVDRVVAERLGSQLRHYDGETHRHMFNLPKFYRQTLESEARVICEETPIYMAHIAANHQ